MPEHAILQNFNRIISFRIYYILRVLCTLGGFNWTIFDPRLFQSGLNFVNLTCQLVEISLGPHVTNFYHLAQIRRIEAPPGTRNRHFDTP